MSKGSIAIDWYSFTIPVRKEITDRAEMGKEIEKVMRYILSPMAFNALLVEGDWSARSGRRPYQAGFASEDIFVWFGGQDTALIEISGNGCARLRSAQVEADNALMEVIRATHERATRLDIAVDIETEMRPEKFVSFGYNKRIRSTAAMKSATGETVYIGSKKGERYARVYRYDNQHRRAHLLRIETVSRSKYAKQVSKFLTYYGVADVAQMTLNYFKFSCPILPKVSEMKETIKLPEKNSSDEKRLEWLKKQVAPAVTDMLVRGVITKEHLLELFSIEVKQEKLF
jgi:DNA relaxase NicK